MGATKVTEEYSLNREITYSEQKTWRVFRYTRYSDDSAYFTKIAEFQFERDARDFLDMKRGDPA